MSTATILVTRAFANAILAVLAQQLEFNGISLINV